MSNLNLNDEVNNNNIIRFNNEGKYWRWTEKKGNLIAYDLEKKLTISLISKFSGLLVMLLGTLLTIFIGGVVLKEGSVLSNVMIPLLLILSFVTGCTLMIGPDYFVYKSTILDKKYFANTINKQTVQKIAKILNLFDGYNKSNEYNAVMQDIQELNAHKLNEKYAALDTYAITQKLEEEYNNNKIKIGATAINYLSDNIIESHVIIERNNDELITDFVKKDNRLSIMHTLEKISNQMSTTDANDYAKCFDTLAKCNNIINDSYNYLDNSSNEKDLVQFRSLTDTALPVFNRIMANVDATRTAKLEAANIYLKDSLGTTNVKEITGTMDYHSVDAFLKEKSNDKVPQQQNK